MMRDASPSDSSSVTMLGIAAEMFMPEDAGFLNQMMLDYFEKNRAEGHACIIDEHEGNPRGVAYFVPVKATDRVWELLMIAVHPAQQGSGHGAAMMAHMEASLRERGQRLVLVQTSASPRYERTRAFYLKLGYEIEARVRDYYTEGEDMIMFRKDLTKQ
jgi:ribosomal protein S18 acetylase RimI-like enzyme